MATRRTGYLSKLIQATERSADAVVSEIHDDAVQLYTQSPVKGDGVMMAAHMLAASRYESKTLRRWAHLRFWAYAAIVPLMLAHREECGILLGYVVLYLEAIPGADQLLDMFRIIGNTPPLSLTNIGWLWVYWGLIAVMIIDPLEVWLRRIRERDEALLKELRRKAREDAAGSVVN